MKNNNNDTKFIQELFTCFMLGVTIIIIASFFSEQFDERNRKISEIEVVNSLSNLPVSPIDEDLNEIDYFDLTSSSFDKLQNDKEVLKMMLLNGEDSEGVISIVEDLIFEYKLILLTSIPREDFEAPAILRDSASELYDLKHILGSDKNDESIHLAFNEYEDKVEKLFNFKRSVINE